jgi:hypothetical protein
MLYALQIASSNLKRMELEKPQPEQVVAATDLDPVTNNPIAVASEAKVGGESNNNNVDRSGEDLPEGTIQACHRPDPQNRNHPTPNRQGRKQYVI